MLRIIFAITAVFALYVVVAEGAECCKAYTDLDLQHHYAQFCPDYCCYALDKEYVQCCDDIRLRVPESKRDQECVNWIQDHIWVPIVAGIVFLIIIIAVVTCCCCCACCACCACCRKSKPRTIIVSQPATPMQATVVTTNNTAIQNTNPLHVGYDYA